MRRAAIVLLATLTLAAPASAAEVSVQDGTLRFQGQHVDADAEQDGSSFSIYDFAGSLEPGDGCALDVPEVPLVGSLSERTITCTDVTAAVEARLEGQGNFLYVSSSLPKRLHGGPGHDMLIGVGAGTTEASGGAGGDFLEGGDGADVLDGGEGDDGLRGRDGTDRLTGGSGKDHLTGDGGFCCIEEPGTEMPPPANTADVLDGGEGSDMFDAVEAADGVVGGAGRDTVFLFAQGSMSVAIGGGGLDVENVTVQGGDATVRGDGRPNEIVTGEGRDTVDPGGGFDTVTTGSGDDSVGVRDGFPDHVDCGEGSDRVVADPGDEVESSCEAVERAVAPGSSPAAPAVVTPTDLLVTARRKGRRVTVRGRLLLPAGTPTAGCRGGGVTLQIRGAARRTLRRGTVLDRRCTFAVRLKGSGKRRVRVKASFAGTPSIAPIAR